MKKFRILFFLVLIFTVLANPIKIFAASFNTDFDTASRSIVLVNMDTDTAIFEKNPNEKMSPASITKIMTYIIAVEQVSDPDGTVINIKNEIIKSLSGTGSSISGLKADTNISVKQLLHCMMIPSGNDAALVLADYIGNGDVNKFVELMNKKALELSCKDTHFVNPHGLYDPDHYTTANDMYKITKYAMTLPYFTEITDMTTSYVFGEDKPPLVTTNSLIDAIRGQPYYYKYAKGIKTGHLDESGYCLVSSATKDGYTYLCIALGALSVDSEGKEIKTNGAMIDSKNLYIWAFQTFSLKQVVSSQDPVCEVRVKFAWNKDSTLLVPQKNYSAILPKNVSISSVEINANAPEFINAPVNKGDPICTATLRYANQDFQVITLVAGEDVKRSEVLFFYEALKNIFTSKLFVISISMFLILLVMYVLVTAIHNKRNKGKKKIKRYKKP